MQFCITLKYHPAQVIPTIPFEAIKLQVKH